MERIRPYYPTGGKGRVPYPLERLLRVHCVQLFYNLSDPGMEDMLYEVESVRPLNLTFGQAVRGIVQPQPSQQASKRKDDPKQ
ncbi:transposase [Candidatus Synechococcus spongiarum]|uniref:transposase n=1 Tax=Candidatus Synechococcus spongiarum TaxID=431041 RepID=UPI001F45D9D0|nr:transposase [Candidatus Synechococcus spongiarum]